MIKIKFNGRRIAGKRAHYGDINHVVNANFVNKGALKSVIALIVLYNIGLFFLFISKKSIENVFYIELGICCLGLAMNVDYYAFEWVSVSKGERLTKLQVKK